MFSILIPWNIWLLTGVTAISMIIATTYGLAPLWAVLKKRKSATEPTAVRQPSLSLIVYSRNDETLLREYLRQLSEQDYPDFETIVVYDSDAETARNLSDNLAEQYPKVKITFMPPDSRNVSRRKLWIMLGMKAAANEVALLTASNCDIPSPRWLSEMMAPFNDPQTQISLGVCNDDFSEIRGVRKYFARFLRVLGCGYWMGYALWHKPFRCDGFNMAIRKDLFFSNKGFARTIHLDSGEEDIFLEEIATRENTKVVLSPEAILTAKWGEHSARRIWQERRSIYAFTEQFLRKAPFVRRDILYASHWMVIAGAAAASICAIPDMLPLCICAALIIILFALDIVAYRKTARTLKAPLLFFSVVLFFLWTPIGKLFSKIGNMTANYKHFTWQKPPK